MVELQLVTDVVWGTPLALTESPQPVAGDREHEGCG
jgi:hypothetical protein